MTPPTTVVRHPVWTWICSFSSLVLLLTLMAMAMHIRLALGRWPHFGEDYKSLLFSFHRTISLGIWMLALLAAPLAWSLLLFFRPFRISWRVHLSQALAYALGWALILTGEKWDPTPFTNWLLD